MTKWEHQNLSEKYIVSRLYDKQKLGAAISDAIRRVECVV